ncbi:MAG: DUF5053 domain-containing protein [Tannerellaceae bacterium]|nr:DUF5053 domain-containing protein [Tannerellaceae bacterium]
MNAEKELQALIAEFQTLKTEEERVVFDEKMNHLLDGKTPEEKKEFRQAFLASARKTVSETKEFLQEANTKMQLADVEPYISLSKIAEHYFGKSRAWLYQRINGLSVNGKPAEFTPEEKKILAEALQDISKKMNATAFNLLN